MLGRAWAEAHQPSRTEAALAATGRRQLVRTDQYQVRNHDWYEDQLGNTHALIDGEGLVSPVSKKNPDLAPKVRVYGTRGVAKLNVELTGQTTAWSDIDHEAWRESNDDTDADESRLTRWDRYRQVAFHFLALSVEFAVCEGIEADSAIGGPDRKETGCVIYTRRRRDSD